MMTKLVDNICHFLVNLLVDLHVSLLVHHRQLYDYLYDHRHIYIPELNLDLLDQLLVDLLHHLCHLLVNPPHPSSLYLWVV